MTTQTISGTYAGVSVASPVTTLSITSSGYLTQTGVFLAFDPVQCTVNNQGTVISTEETEGVPGVSSNFFDGGVTNFNDAAVTIINGGNTNTKATIRSEYLMGVEGYGGAVINFGAIAGSNAYDKDISEPCPGVQMIYGRITNGSNSDTKALITGAVGVAFVKYDFPTATGPAAVTNYGTILGRATTFVHQNMTGPNTSVSVYSSAGVSLSSGGVVTNGGAKDTVALIEGYDGIDFSTTASGSVKNFGTIESYVPGRKDTQSGVAFYYGGQLTNGTSADTSALVQGYEAGVAARGATGTVANFGTVLSTGKSTRSGAASVAVALYGGGSVTNGGASDTIALVQGYLGVVAGSDATIANFGTIAATSSAGTSAAADIGFGGTVTNGAAGDTAALIEGSNGVWADNNPSTVVNYGTIQSDGAKSGKHGIYLGFGGYITNGAATDTAALIQGYQSAVLVQTTSGFIDNFGTIANTASVSGHAGVSLGAGGTVTNGSTADLTALITGYQALVANGAVATVVNFGRIESTGLSSNRGAVALYEGGAVTNGEAAMNGAAAVYIMGREGVTIEGAAGSVANFGVIASAGKGTAANGKHGVLLANGGVVTNGAAASAGAPNAVILGYQSGVAVTKASGTVHNYGSIVSLATAAGQAGVYLQDGGLVTNGASAHAIGLIKGDEGVLVQTGVGFVNNFGTIVATGGAGAWGVNITVDGLVTNYGQIEGFNGVALTGDVVSDGAITATGATGFGVVLAGAGSYLRNGHLATQGEGGGSGPPAQIKGDVGVLVSGASMVVNFGSIVAGASGLAACFLAPGGTLVVEPECEFTGKSVGDGGTLILKSGLNTGTLSGLAGGDVTVSGSMPSATFDDFHTIEVATAASFADTGPSAVGAADTLVDEGALTASGTLTNAGQVDISGGDLTVAAAGLMLTGSGAVNLSNSAANEITGATAGATLKIEQLVEGAGALGAGSMTLIVGAAGTIESAGTAAFTINTGGQFVANGGSLEASSAGGLAIASAVNNAGLLVANLGTLAVAGGVTGMGSAKVAAGWLKFGAAFNQDVAFSGTGGVLELADSQAFAGTISGFSLTGATKLDLDDIAWLTTEGQEVKASYSGTTSGGVLTVTSLNEVAKIHFTGNYAASTWTLSNDGHGGTFIVDPVKAADSTVPRFVAAMTGVGGGGAAPAVLAPRALPDGLARFATPHAAVV